MFRKGTEKVPCTKMYQKSTILFQIRPRFTPENTEICAFCFLPEPHPQPRKLGRSRFGNRLNPVLFSSRRRQFFSFVPPPCTATLAHGSNLWTRSSTGRAFGS